MRSSPAGSDQQLVGVRSLAGLALGDEALDELAGLLDGTRALDGLTIDADLRWSLVIGLARAGRLGEDQIDDELARDRTISGKENAAAAHAARPTPEAKEQAFQDIFVRDNVPNETHRSIALSWARYGQEDLLAPYLEQFLEAAETVWERQGTHMATDSLEYGFPKLIGTAEVVGRLDAWLEESPANPAAKRFVAEARDDMARALAAQARDSAAK